MNDPEGLAVDPQGNLYIADMGNGRIRKVSPAGTITTLAKGFNQPTGVAVDRQWNVYVAAFASGAVFKVTPRGELTRIVGNGHAYPNLDGGPAGNSWVNSPSGVAVDGNGSLYVADYGQSRIRKVRNVLPIASFTTAPASGQAPLSVVVDASASRDPDGSIVKYALEFGDGTTSRGWKLSHSYTHAGSFTVTLTVTDDSGAVSKTARRTVTVR